MKNSFLCKGDRHMNQQIFISKPLMGLLSRTTCLINKLWKIHSKTFVMLIMRLFTKYLENGLDVRRQVFILIRFFCDTVFLDDKMRCWCVVPLVFCFIETTWWKPNSSFETLFKFSSCRSSNAFSHFYFLSRYFMVSILEAASFLIWILAP